VLKIGQIPTARHIRMKNEMKVRNFVFVYCQTSGNGPPKNISPYRKEKTTSAYNV